MAPEIVSGARVAVYIDFDNIVISRYNQLFGRGAFTNDGARNAALSRVSAEAVQRRLDDARVDVGAILDYASSFGSIVISRAYADWSVPANSAYQRQLIDRAVDLTQLFNTAGTKNGADIRLAVDVVEDLFRLDDVTHVVIVAGDSDYIALAQRAKRLGRFVVGIGVAGATSRSLVAACDQFSDYDELPGIPPVVPVEPAKAEPQRSAGRAAASSKPVASADQLFSDPATADPAASTPLTDADATGLLVRAMQLIDAKNDEEWQTNGEVKSQMIRLDPSFKEKTLGFKSFSEFLASRADVVEIKAKSKPNDRRLKLRGPAG